MTLTQNDHTDIGTLLAYALQPTQRPGRSQEYRRVLARYRTESDFRIATDAILHGLHTRVLSDGDFGLVLGVSPESPFAFRVSDMPHATASRTSRLMAGLVLVGVAAFAYPTPADLEEERIRRVRDVEFEQWMRSACEQMLIRDAAGEPVPDDGLDEAWRVYHEMPSTLVGEKGRASGRLSSKCTLYWVRNVLAWLVEQGMARADNTGGTWMLTERFRIQVKDMASEPAYAFLAELARRGPVRAPGPPRSAGGLEDS